MAEALETRNWWTKPQAVLPTLAVAFAVVVPLAVDIDEVEEWLGASEPVPLSLSLQIGKVTRIDRNNVVAVLSYNKVGSARLRNCRFWMDAGDLQTPGEIPEFKIARGSSAKDLNVAFGLGVIRAQLAPDATITLSCDKASSAAVPLNLRDVMADKP